MEKKKKGKWKQYVAMLMCMLIGAVCGVVMSAYMDKIAEAGGSMGDVLFRTAILFVGMYIAMIVQIIIHEAGHLIFGLLSGYKFCSFRIFSFMWQKVDDKIEFKKFSLAGTSGQCLMDPPDIEDGKIPYVLYNLGGSIINVVAGVLFGVLYLLTKGVPMLSYWFLMFAFIGIAFALINGIPMRLGTVDNDGYNALSLGKNPEALRSFWIQMKINYMQTMGVRLRELPEEWFEVPSDEDMKNSMVAVMGVTAVSRLMDENKFDEAYALMNRLLGMETGIVDLHRNLMTCDRMFCELIGENRKDIVDEMYDKEQKQFMKSMKTYLAVIRTEYVYALLGEMSETKAEVIKERFDKAAEKYPFVGDLECEREYLALADEKYRERMNAQDEILEDDESD